CCPLALPRWISWTVCAAGACALAGLASLLLLPRLRPWLARSDRLVRLVDGALVYLAHPREVAAATALSVLVQAAGVVTVWLIGRFPRFAAGAAGSEAVEGQPGGAAGADPAADEAEEAWPAAPAPWHTRVWRCDPMWSLSVVIPIKDERDNLRPLNQRLRQAL